jgi:hypothetical protein
MFDEKGNLLEDGGDCPKCNAVESIRYCPDSGRGDECYRCDECDEVWFIERRIV